jgi:8-hydroxy-5-deazaflavin:NADPH oxidoreductase
VRIGILGTGTMGMALGRLFARSGHDVVFGSRSDARARTAAAAVRRASGGSYEGALVGSDLVALAAVWADVEGVLAEIPIPAWTGRILVDCTNPEPATGRGLLLGHTTSGAEEIARRARGALVVKALNHIYAEALDALRGHGAGPIAFYCGDDGGAKALVAGLLDGSGLRAVDAGPLRSARYLEPLAALMVELVHGQGRAPVEVARLTEVGIAARSGG